MEFGVLGPLFVRECGVDRTPTAPKQRQLLALLLLSANRIVSVARVINELWTFDPPQSAVAAVQTYVMQLRRLLDGQSGRRTAASQRLLTRGHGYLIQVRSGELDLERFASAARSASALLAAGDNEFVAERLRSSLELWRGPALVDVTVGPVLAPDVAAIERNRLDVVSKRIQAELNLGRHHELIGELSALAHHHPVREDFVEQLMLALYRCGRRADALAAFHRLRRRLRGSPGAAMSPRLHVLYRDILSGHARLDQAVPTRARLSLDLFTNCAA
jgi:DNA-binding SARP family transcriptional activator